jgi:hypothetical protein
VTGRRGFLGAMLAVAATPKVAKAEPLPEFTAGGYVPGPVEGRPNGPEYVLQIDGREISRFVADAARYNRFGAGRGIATVLR